MNKSLVLGVIITASIIGGLIYYFYNTQVSVRETPALEAVPDDAAIVFEINDASQGWANLYNTGMWKDLKKSDDFNQFSAKLVSLDSLVFNNTDFRKVLKNYKLFFSVHPSLSGKLQYLFVIELNKKLDLDYIDKWLKQNAGKGTSVGNRVFNKVKIHELNDEQKHPVLSFTIYDGLLIFSETGSLVDDALRKMISGTAEQKKIFEPVRTLTTPNVQANIYLNYANLPAFFRCFSNKQNPTLFNFISDFANTSALDLRVNQAGILLTGVTNTSIKQFNYLDLFRQQMPQKNTITKLVPNSTAFMLHMGIGDPVSFTKDLKEFLSSKGLTNEYRNFSDSLFNLYKIRVEENLIPVMGNEVALVMNENTSVDYTRDIYAVIKSTNKEIAQQNIGNLKRAVAAKGSADSVSITYNGIPVSRLPLGNYLKLIYGGIFNEIQSPFIAVLDEYVVMANNYNTLKQVIDGYKDGQTLINSESYKTYADINASPANVSVMFNIPKCLFLPSVLGSEGIISSISRNQAFYKKFEYVTLQYSSTNNKMFYSNINYKFAQSFTEETRKLWNVQLDTTPAIKPYVLYDSETRQYVVLVQDVLNTVYLYENNGNLRWDKKLEGRIMGDIVEVDAMNNGQRQYLFNTADYVYLLDAAGRNMLNYPMKLGAKASAGLTVLKPDTGDIRYYIPCENQNAYGYTVKGKLLDGWNPRTLEYNVAYRIRTFRMGSRQFLYSSTERGTVYIWQQKGLRAPFNYKKSTVFTTPYSVKVIDTSSARLFALDTNGYIYSYIFGAKADSLKPVFAGAGNYMEAIDVDFDGHTEFLVGGAGSYRLISESGKEISRFNADDTAATEPFFIELNGKLKIGIASPAHNKVYLFHSNGTAYSSFPVNGVTSFMTSDFYQNGNRYMVVGDTHGYINLYLLK